PKERCTVRWRAPGWATTARASSSEDTNKPGHIKRSSPLEVALEPVPELLHRQTLEHRGHPDLLVLQVVDQGADVPRRAGSVGVRLVLADAGHEAGEPLPASAVELEEISCHGSSPRWFRRLA